MRLQHRRALGQLTAHNTMPFAQVVLRVGFEPTNIHIFNMVLLYMLLMGGDGVEPPEPEDSRFTVCPATTYGISSQIFNSLGES